MSGAPSQFQIASVEKALLTLLKSALPAEYGTGVDVDSIGDKDFLEDGTLVLKPPAVRVRFAGGSYANLRDNQRLTYEATMLFEVMSFETSLRSKADERLRTLKLVQAGQNVLAGSRLALDDGTSSAPLELREVSPVITEDGPVDQLFSLTIAIKGIAQYSGANARMGS